MVQFRVLLDGTERQRATFRRFPCLVGRSASAHLRLEDPGVWDRHLEIGFEEGHGFLATVLPGALASMNGQPFQSGSLRNGDVLGLGSVQLEFSLSEARPKGLRWREGLTWLFLAGLGGIQILLVYLLER